MIAQVLEVAPITEQVEAPVTHLYPFGDRSANLNLMKNCLTLQRLCEQVSVLNAATSDAERLVAAEAIACHVKTAARLYTNMVGEVIDTYAKAEASF